AGLTADEVAAGSGRRRSRRELEVQGAQPAEDPGRFVDEATRGWGTVVRLRETDVVHPVEDALQADAGFAARQRPSRAGVRAAPERDVLPGVRPVEPELGGALEVSRVAVRGAVQQHDRRARGDVDVADPGGPPGQAEVGLDRALDAERLLDEVGDASGVGPQLVLER